MEEKFHIGDKVYLTKSRPTIPVGAAGIIKDTNGLGYYAVEFDKHYDACNDCGGKCDPKRGFWVANDLALLGTGDKPKKPKQFNMNEMKISIPCQFIKLYTGRVMCVSNEDGYPGLFTQCKIYDVKDGYIAVDNGCLSGPWYNVDDFLEAAEKSGFEFKEIKLYNGKVVCTKVNREIAHWFTPGKIYTFVNGETLTNTFQRYGLIRDFEDLLNVSNSEFIEIVEG